MKRLRWLLPFVLSSSAHASDLGLLKQACAACHLTDVKRVGPAFREVAARYRTKAAAEQLLAASIQKGSRGNWGPVPMPPSDISVPDARKLAQWVLRM